MKGIERGADHKHVSVPNAQYPYYVYRGKENGEGR